MDLSVQAHRGAHPGATRRGGEKGHKRGRQKMVHESSVLQRGLDLSLGEQVEV